MATKCVFCGGRADSLEHVWPRWVSRHFAGCLLLTLVDRSRGVPPRSMNILDAQVRRVCQTCNGGWMSQLEVRAKPLLEPMFDGKPVTLEQDEQAVVAAWVVKTLMMLDLWRPDPEAFSPSRHQQLYRSGAAPLDTVVLLALVDRPTQHAFYALPSKAAGELHRLTMNVGCLVAQVRLVSPIGFGQGWEAKRSSVQIWPSGVGSLDWPPPERLWDATVSHFATSGMAYD